ncbi:hypothetical protein Pmob_0087 [Petrotoga mobilis SJ95]|jgi:flagellar biosynthesis protein FlhB|uniref:Uncharacterized protein n=1 Tax=Petrotoga mobilis (strain DSM 10674 / SJ95) TaxID=403833 RepID=A9BEV8_PETMO|nr:MULTISPECIES: hypothetical protein [Petrotoga]ABX30836.1 hypothetical protein Pmob_0087 [Petrotoga mobilis SJ95]MBL5982173.1 hypothetical protein [Petrotoga sp. 8T1HF07.NaAc.6.1]PNR89344.1 hypothetical protein X925_03880 [Petrotoga sp. 9T1HF07.CasAA.8.2]PNR92700.1 hypothetical protein X926_05420 [Petrotoga sp. HWHPT.55.6.3]RPD36516.1 hypothetical protein HWHPT5561_01525 [Petrotoga sp. HWH.PT.55.6.1]
MRIKLGDVFTEPFKIVGKNPIILIPVFIGIILTLLFDAIRFIGPIANFLSSIVIGISTMFLIAWIAILFDQYKKGEKIDLKNSFSQVNQLLLDIIVLSIVVGFLISLGTLAYVIPGLILALFLIFSPSALVVDKLSVTDSLKRSFSFVFNGENFLQIFLLLLVIFLLGMIPVVGLYLSIILEFILLPYIYVEYSK